MYQRTAGSLAGVAVVLVTAGPLRATTVPARPTSPLSGVVRTGGVPVPGATLLVRFVSGGTESAVRMLKTDVDGTFVLPNAPQGLYTFLSLVPGFQPALARILHGVRGDSLSFVPLDLEKPSGVLPGSALGAADPWIARVVMPGDVLRDVPEILAALDGGMAPAGPALVSLGEGHTVKVPVHASVSTTAGFGAVGEGNVTRTSLDLSGAAGEKVRWGFGGQYSRADNPEGVRVADASRFAVDVESAGDQTLRLATRRQSLPVEATSDASRFAAHSVDWTGATGASSQASVSARLVSQTRLFQTGPVSDLFARESNSLDVAARYRADLGSGRYVRTTVGYRSASTDLTAPTVAGDRETRVGGVAGVRMLEAVVLEGGATGDFSARSRGVTPELTVALEQKGWKVYGFASRRYERRFLDETAPGLVGSEEADLTRLSRSLYRGGVRFQDPDGEGVSVEASRRELAGTYRFLLDPDFFVRLDSLYFFEGDVATEVASSATVHVVPGVDSRVSARVGRIAGQREAAIQRDEASYGVAEAALRIIATRTSVGVGYRVVSQTLSRGMSLLRNDLESVDFSVAQMLPVPLLQALGSEWRALFSVELGKRREGEEQARLNRRLAGGLALSF